jgi:protein-tyrosine phosphatase
LPSPDAPRDATTDAPRQQAAPGSTEPLGILHRAFDRLYPAIRFSYERIAGHEWFSEVLPHLWLGGAPTYKRDFAELLELGITAVVDVRAERDAHEAFFREHGITHRQYRVPDVTVPGEEILDDAVAWIDAQLADGRKVLVHCAKGRGRSATVLAAYLMKTGGLTFDEVDQLLTERRSLVKLQQRHRKVLEQWIARAPGDIEEGSGA